MEEKSLARQSSGLLAAGQTSSSDLALAKLLDLAAQIYGAEIMSGQMRVWSTCFQGESPTMLDYAFRVHFEVGKFFPRPADIRDIIKERRQTIASEAYTYKPIDVNETLRHQQSAEFRETLKSGIERLRRVMSMPRKLKSDPATGTNYYSELSDDELRDRREILRQQAEKVTKLKKAQP